MDRTPLVEHDLQEGRRLVQALDLAKFPLPAAYWLYHSGPDLWRLTLSSPVADEDGGFQGYKIVQKTMTNTSPPIDLSLDNITVVSERDPTSTDIRIHAGTDGKPFVNEKPLSGSSMTAVYPHRIYVYRAERIVGGTGDTVLPLAIPEKVGGRRIWRRKDIRLTFKEGYAADAKAEGYDLKKRYTRNGVHTQFHTFTKIQKVGDKEYGDVQKMVFTDGRLRAVEDIASHVEIAP